MSVEDELVGWISNRPGWQQSVVARLCKQEPFDEAATAALADDLIANKQAGSVSVLASDIPGSAVAGDGVSLVAIEGLQGLNALVDGQGLSFGAAGITIVYGDNASGKSGYARLLRNMVGGKTDLPPPVDLYFRLKKQMRQRGERDNAVPKRHARSHVEDECFSGEKAYGHLLMSQRRRNEPKAYILPSKSRATSWQSLSPRPDRLITIT